MPADPASSAGVSAKAEKGDGMPVIERYVVGRWDGNPAVCDTSKSWREVIAVCGVEANAERIVAALNEQEARNADAR